MLYDDCCNIDTGEETLTTKIIFIFVLILLLVGMVNAQPPFLPSQEQSGTGIDIAYPKNEFYPVDNVIDLHFHAYNSSGYILTNETTDCLFHLYNSTGNHVFNNSLNFSNNGYDFEIDIDTNGLLVGEVCTYIIFCNNSEEAGFVSNAYSIAETTVVPKEVDNLGITMGLSFMAILFISFGIYLWTRKQDGDGNAQ